MDKGNKPNRLLWILGVAAVAAFLIILGLYIAYFKNLSITNDSATWGTFGDYLGGTLNPIISFLALIGLLITIHQQAKEMKATREELKQAAKQQKRQLEISNLQQFESTFFSLLNQHNKMIEKIKSNTKELEELLYLIYIRYDELKTITTTKPSLRLSNGHAIKIVNENYELKNYFNILFQMLKLISIHTPYYEEDFNEIYKTNSKDFYLDNQESKEKISSREIRKKREIINDMERMYSEIIRSTIPNNILQFLTITCLTMDKFYQNKNFKTLYNFQYLLNRYSFLEHFQTNTENIKFEDKTDFHPINHKTLMSFLILTSHKDIEPAFGTNTNILSDMKFLFKDNFNSELEEKSNKKKHLQNELNKTQKIIDYIESISHDEYKKLDDNQKGIFNDHDKFDTWEKIKQPSIEHHTKKKQSTEEELKKISLDINSLEKNKKAWLEFLQIEDD